MSTLCYMKGILLHGGHGTRLRPLTHTGPKQLLPIANKPMSQYCIESMKEAGVTEIAVIIGGVGLNKVREYYGNGEKFGVKISYIYQDQPKGISHAISLCKDFVGDENFIVYLGDNVLRKNLIDFTRRFEDSDSDAMILLCEVDDPSRFGVAEIDGKQGKYFSIQNEEKRTGPPQAFGSILVMHSNVVLVFKCIQGDDQEVKKVDPQKVTSYGTCFAVSPTEVLTSHHVIAGADVVTVQFQGGDDIGFCRKYSIETK